jgi:hypothetical protein
MLGGNGGTVGGIWGGEWGRPPKGGRPRHLPLCGEHVRGPLYGG